MLSIIQLYLVGLPTHVLTFIFMKYLVYHLLLLSSLRQVPESGLTTIPTSQLCVITV